MPESDDDRYEHLLDEIKELTRPTSLGSVFKGATGTVLPGFAVLPAVTILAGVSPQYRSADSPEEWVTGDLLALRPAVAAGETPAETEPPNLGERVLFTPLGATAVPLLDVTPTESGDDSTVAFQVRPHVRWEETSIQFAFLPWGEEDDVSKWSATALVRAARELQYVIPQVTADLEVNGQTAQLELELGLRATPLHPVAEGIRFPLCYATENVKHFFFRVTLGPRVRCHTGEVKLDSASVNLRFRVPSETFRTLYSRIGIAPAAQQRFTIHPNALPLANVDLKAWPTGDAFADFVGETGMKPLGTAGVFPYRSASRPRLDQLRSYVFSVDIDPRTTVLQRYSIAGSDDDTADSQLLMWMSMGDRVNGMHFTREATEVRQPLERTSTAFNKAGTVLPCFGGLDCAQPGRQDLNWSLMLNLTPAPQAYAFSDGLVFAVQELLTRLGYEGVEVGEPHTEARVIDGVRRRVVILTCSNPGGNRIESNHLAALQAFVSARTPPGVTVVVEEQV